MPDMFPPTAAMMMRCDECGYMTTAAEAEARVFNPNRCPACDGALSMVPPPRRRGRLAVQHRGKWASIALDDPVIAGVAPQRIVQALRDAIDDQLDSPWLAPMPERMQ